MKQIYMLDYIKESIDNKYAMEVLYYTIKNAVITNDYNLKDVLFVDIDGRYHGNEILVGTRMRYRSDLHTISMLLSIRAERQGRFSALKQELFILHREKHSE